MSRLESQIAFVSGDLLSLQTALENSALSDDMRVRIRRAIERTLETLYIKKAEEKEQQEIRKLKEAEVAEKQARINEYIRQYAELQARQEAETRRTEINRQFYALAMNMSYTLNGIPRWPISVMPPLPEKQLNEKAFVQTLKDYSTKELLDAVFKSQAKKPNPETAVTDLRASVLGVKELLRRGGVTPGDGDRSVEPKKIHMASEKVTSIKFNARRQ